MKKNQLKAGSILTYIQMILNIVISVVYTPVMIRVLGKSEYGLYTTITSTIAMLAILNFGFSSSYIKFFTKYRQENDEDGEKRLNGLYVTVFLVIGLVALVIGSFLSFNLDIIFSTGLTQDEYKLARILMLMLTFNTAMNFPMSVFSSIVTAHEKYVYLKIVSCIKTVANPILMLPLLLLGFRSITMVVVTILVNLIADLLYMYYALYVLKAKFLFSKFEKKLFLSIFTYTSFIAVNIIVDQVNSNVNKLVLGRYRGTEAVAIYSVGFLIYTYFTSFSTAISNVFIPKIHRIVVEESSLTDKNNKLTDLFIRVGRIQFYVLSLIATGFIFFGKPFIRLWSGIEEFEVSYFVALLLIIPSMVPLCQNVGIEIQRAKNKHHFRSIAYLIMALLNVILTVWLCQVYGIVGAAVGAAASLLIANGIIMNIYYHKEIGLDIIKYWKNVLRISLGIIPPSIYGILIMKRVENLGYFGLVKFGIPYVLIFVVSVWFLSFNKYEKDLVKDLLRKAKLLKR